MLGRRRRRTWRSRRCCPAPSSLPCRFRADTATPPGETLSRTGARRRQRLRQPRRAVAAALRGQDGAGVRPPGRRRDSEPRQPAPAGVAGGCDVGPARRSELVANAAVLGRGCRSGSLGSCVQGCHRANQCQVHGCGGSSLPHRGKHVAFASRRRPVPPADGALGRQPECHALRLLCTTEDPRPAPQPVVVKQLPTVPPDRYEEIRFGSKTAADVIREAVLELTPTTWRLLRET